MLGLFSFLKINKLHYFYNSLLTFFKSNSMIYFLDTLILLQSIYLALTSLLFQFLYAENHPWLIMWIESLTCNLLFLCTIESLYTLRICADDISCIWGVDVDIFVMGIFRRWFDLIRISCRSALKYLQVMKAFIIIIFNCKFLLKYEKLRENICLWNFFMYSSPCR